MPGPAGQQLRGVGDRYGVRRPGVDDGVPGLGGVESGQPARGEPVAEQDAGAGHRVAAAAVEHGDGVAAGDGLGCHGPADEAAAAENQSAHAAQPARAAAGYQGCSAVSRATPR